MVDGKVAANVSNTGCMTCNVCGATPSAMNSLPTLKLRAINEQALKLGLSTVHLWIRTLEYCLECGHQVRLEKMRIICDTNQVSQGLDLKTWKRTGDEAKKTISKTREKELQDLMWKELGLHINKPKPGGGWGKHK
eukprot:Pompholyxophrys_punicea_v1_NODE_475_length_1877_cov_32.252470.p1 type:complete len:136 gc:universal NODE_475_length_1877_cov_32.252470:700-1107(+)